MFFRKNRDTGTKKARRARGLPRLEMLEDRTVFNASPIGAQFLVNETLAPPENPPAVAVYDVAGGGDFIAVWQSYGQDGDGFGIYAQLFNEDGSAITGQPAFQVNLPPVVGGPAVGNQLAPTVASDGAGHFVIAWQGENQATGDYDVYYRQGSFIGGTITLEADAHQANTLYVSGQQSAPTAAMDASGNFAIAWQSQDLAHPEFGYDIYAKQGTLAVGLSSGDEFIVNTGYKTGDQTNATASMNAVGDFVVAWRGPDAAVVGEEVPAVLFNVFYADGGTLAHTGEVKANATAYHDIGAPDIAINAAGTIVVAWQVEGQPESGSDIFGRRFSFSKTGTPQVSPLATGTSGLNDFQLNTTTSGPQRAPSVGIDDSGDFFAAWQTQHQDGFSWAVFGKRYDAAANAFGAESLVNAGTQMGPQINPDVAMTAGGRTVVIWMGPDVPQGTEEGEGGHKPGIHAHIFNDAGLTTVGAAEVLLATYSAIEDQPSAAAMDAAGNYVVVWQSWEDTGDGSDFGIYAKLFQANGKPIDVNENGLDDDRMLVNVTKAGSQSAPAVAMDQAGNFVVAWQSALQDGSGAGIYARRYNASYKAWEPEGELLVNVVTVGDQAKPKVALDAAGNFVVVWQSQDGTNPDTSPSTGIFGRRWDAALKGWSPQGEFRINAEVLYDQVAPVISMNAAGQFVVAWVGDNGVLLNPLDSEKSIFVQWFDTNGQALLAADYLANKYVKDAQEHPALAIAPNGNFVAAWQSINQEMNVEGVGNSWGVYANQFVVDAAAHTITRLNGKDEFRVNETTDGPQRFPEVGIDQAGNFVVAWQSIRQDASSWAVLARQYNANGTAAGGEALVNTYTSGPQILPVIAERGTGDFAIFWDGQAPGHLEGVSGQRFHFVRDDFNRGNFPSLGPDWTVRVGNYDIHDNVAAVQTTLGLSTLNGVNLADVSVEGRVTLGGGLVQIDGLVARYAGPGDASMYFGALRGEEGSFKAEIWRQSGGVWTQLASQAVTAGQGLLRFDLVGSSLKLFLDDKLVAFATDNVITAAGQIGIRGTNDTTVDDFSYAPLTRVVPSLPFRDFFYLSTPSQLSSFWVETYGNFKVENGVASNNLAGGTSVALLHGVSEADVAVEADIALGAGQVAGLLSRYAPGSYYRVDVQATTTGAVATLYAYTSAIGQVQLASATVGTAGRLRLETVGSSQKVFLDGSLVLFAHDAQVAGPGTVGIKAVGAGAALDDFAANKVAATAALPFSDGFDLSAPVATDQLDSAKWLETYGNFKIVGGAAQNNVPGATGYSVAVLREISKADVAAQADIDVNTTTKHNVGLFARYGAGGYYRVDAYANGSGVTGNGVTVQLVSFNAATGTFSVVASKTMASAKGTLRVEVVGTSQKVFLDADNNNDGTGDGSPILLFFANDSSVQTAGTLGMKAYGPGSSLDNFKADEIAAAPLLGTEDFSAATASQLNNTRWVEPYGNFTVTGGAASSNASLAIALLRSFSSSSMFAEAEIGFPGTGRTGGLFTQYSASGYYRADVTTTATGFTVTLVRYSASTGLTTLGTYSDNSGTPTTIKLRLETTSTRQDVFLNGSLTPAIHNTSTAATALAAGTAGIKANGPLGTTLDNFSAGTI